MPIHDNAAISYGNAWLRQSHATASTCEQALAALESAIEKRLDRGELVALEVRRRGLAGLFGKYPDDPTLQQICEEAYHERDADVQE